MLSIKLFLFLFNWKYIYFVKLLKITRYLRTDSDDKITFQLLNSLYNFRGYHVDIDAHGDCSEENTEALDSI